ncbi:hypothetical protein [Leucobacter sp. wl10]|uniref:hypothetical protein n=1 Tax=Leucobacter sp. wl10 TaxID=2304677 RepID=UPI000E5ADECA|nr:hypothetical protein [Leucobacter sp. wl10]RGE24189.1 hypothetical protein D1J51_00100 [Leucobacter sp. wl10]
MITRKEVNRNWSSCFRDAARRRGLRTVSGWAYNDDGAFVATVSLLVGVPSDPLRVHWDCGIKPLAVDDVLWAAFMPKEQFSAAKRRSLRVDGAFSSSPLEIGGGTHAVSLKADPEGVVGAVLDDFESLRAEFVRAAPGPSEYLEFVRRATPPGATPQDLLRKALALEVAGCSAEAVALLEDALARGECGPMGGPDGEVFELLIRWVRAEHPEV